MLMLIPVVHVTCAPTVMWLWNQQTSKLILWPTVDTWWYDTAASLPAGLHVNIDESKQKRLFLMTCAFHTSRAL